MSRSAKFRVTEVTPEYWGGLEKVKRPFRKLLERNAPLTNQMFFGRKYVLPKYREPDYVSMEPAAHYDLDRLLQFSANEMSFDDEVSRCAVGATIAAIGYHRPVLWLERELAEMLLRTRLLEDLSTGDIKWKWPAFKIVLPNRILSIMRDGEPRSLTHFDICKIGRYPEGDELKRCPVNIARELDALAAKIADIPNRHTIEGVDFGFGQDHGICITSVLDRPDNAAIADQTVYALTKPWGQVKVSDYTASTGDLDTPFESDKLDKGLLKRLEHLVLNVLIFMSSTPLLYDTEVIRKMSMEGKHMVPGLLRARFVGQTALKPIRIAHHPSQPTGRHTAPHWVCGAWRRQRFGPGLTQEKIIWIQPYRTGVHQENEEMQTMR